MGVHTDNERLREKINHLASVTGLEPGQALEQALDLKLSTLAPTAAAGRTTPEEKERRKRAACEILGRIDALPELPPDQQRPLPEWDEVGLPE